MDKLQGKKKLIKDISANTIQMVVSQFFGLLIFYFTSRYLSKTDFGEFNWTMAVGATIIAISSLGLDLVFVKRVASSEDILIISGIHLFHTVLVGVVLGSIVFLINLLVPDFTDSHPLFFYVFISLAISNMGNSFKLCLNGLESYKQLAILSFCVNVLKFLGILVLYCIGAFTVLNVILVYMFSSVFEFLLGYYFLHTGLSLKIKPLLRMQEYKYFIIESLPQLGVVLFDSALARIDWILLGIISTATVTAEYSFAYKIFELSKLPLLIISPILLTRFSKMFAQDNVVTEDQTNTLRFLFRMELFIVMVIPVILISTWSPLIDYLTNNKYGKANEITYWILALCIPMHGIINFLWTLAFVKGRLKALMYITISASVLNIGANLLLIPFFGGIGAALAFLLSTLFQLFLYLKYLQSGVFKLNFMSCALAFINALLALSIGKLLFDNIFISASVALAIYFTLALVTKQIEYKKIRMFLE